MVRRLVPLLALLAACNRSASSKPQDQDAAAASAMPPPAPGVRYIVGGDSRDDSAHVLPWAFGEAKRRGAVAVLFLGDMELTPELDKSFARELALLDPIPFYPVLGNHEVEQMGFLAIDRSAAERTLARRFLATPRTPVRSSLPDRIVYSVDLPGGVHFVALDNVSQAGFGKEQLGWLAGDLARAHVDKATKHILVGMHKPLAHNGVSTHGMDHDGAAAVADSDAALALFVKEHVDLILESHVHEFAKLEQAGIPSYITGGLGAPLTRSGPEHAFHHFLELDVTDAGIHVEVVRFTGAPAMGEQDDDD